MLAKIVGGSHLYGLATPDSDLDYRGVYMNTDAASILGLSSTSKSAKHEVRQNDQEDVAMYELRHFMELLKNTNTQVMEILFAEENAFVELSPWFKKRILKERLRLIDTKKAFSTLCGYMQGEKRRANGELTGKLGSKRQKAIEQYGYSPKNFVQLLRLGYCGCELISRKVFPTNIMTYDTEFGMMLKAIKIEPEGYDRELLNLMAEEADKGLRKTFDERNESEDLVFDEDYANFVLLEAYIGPLSRENRKGF